jgi:hypothetical protein
LHWREIEEDFNTYNDLIVAWTPLD